VIESRVAVVRRPTVEYVQRKLEDLGVRVPGVVPDAGAEWVPAATLYRLWDAAERQAGDALIGLRVAAGMAASDFGVLSEVFERAPTLGEALAELSLLSPLIDDGSRLVLVVNGLRTTFEFVVDEPSLLHPRAAEHVVAMLAFAVQARLPDHASVGLAMHWAHPRPRTGTDYAALLGMPVRFDAGWNGLSFATVALRSERVSERADRAGLDEARRRAEDGLRALREPGIVVHVRALVATELGAGRPVSETAIARHLGLHPKALSRRLVGRGTTFRRLVEGERHGRARRLLEAGRSVDEVARRVGYTDPSAFSRAFKRWTGSTPTAYAARVRADGAGPA
jgi:AraC-like DNA-binding protein